MLNPLDVERRFLEVQHLLGTHLTFRHQWYLIFEFLTFIRPQLETYDTHCEQLLSQLPVFSHPLSITGTDPAHFQSILSLLDDFENTLPQLKKIENYREAKESLHVATVFLLCCVNKWSKAYEILGIENIPIKDEASSVKTYIQNLQSHKYYRLRKSFRRKVEALSNWCEIEKTFEINTLFVPVVEIGDGTVVDGRLRLLTATVIGSRASKDQFRNSYSVIGAEGKDAGLSRSVQKTTRKLLDDSHPELNDHFFDLKFDYEMPYGVQRGRSSELASSLTAYTSILNYTKSRERYIIKQPIAVSGKLKDDGTVATIDPEGIESKVRAAFFSWIKFLVVPAQQKQAFNGVRDTLNEKYPAKELIIIGLEKPEAYFYDRRLSEHRNDSRPIHTAKKLWAKKFSVAGVVIILLLLTAVGRLSYGPIDKNPVYGEFSGEYLNVFNQKESLIASYRVGQTSRDYNEINYSNGPKPQVQFADLNEDGVNEVFWFQAPDDATEKLPKMVAWSVSGDSLIWNRSLLFNIDYPKQPAIVGNQYRLNEFYVVDNQESDPIIIAAMNLETYFPALIVSMDATNGDVTNKYAHPGYFGDIIPLDITNDEMPEILATGVNNAYSMSFLAALKLETLQGHAPTRNDYIVSNLNPADHYAYILVPKTIVGQNYDSVSRFNYGRSIIYTSGEELIDFFVADINSNLFDDGWQPGIVITMNKDFEVVGIGTDDRYDIISDELFEAGEIPFKPDNEYFEAFKDSLFYWDGRKGEFSPTK